MDPISLLVAGIAILGVIIVSIYMYNSDKNIKTDTQDKLVNIVKQVNVTQKANYNLDVKQEKNLEDMKKNFTTDKLSFSGSNNYTIYPHGSNLNFGSGSNVTMTMDTNNLYVDNLKSIGSNLNIGTSMRIESSNVYVDTLMGINKKLLFTADGKMTMSMDSSNLNLPSNINIGNKYKLRDENNLLRVTGDVKIDKLQLGDKFRFSGVGDKHANDNWLRMFDKDGNDYRGGIAMAELYVRDQSHLNGTTNAIHLNVNSLGRKGGDWLRVYGHETSHGTAIHGNTAINHQGGLVVGAWEKVPQGTIKATGHVETPSLGRKGGDWLRIFGHETSHGTAIHGNTAINHEGGLVVGAWEKVPQGTIKATGHVETPSLGRKGGDWLRVFGHETSQGTAIFGNTAINHGGGLVVGAWDKVPQGQIKATGRIHTDEHVCAGAGCQSIMHNNGHIHANYLHSRGDMNADGNITIGRHIDAHQPWAHGKKSLFAGWSGDQVILGNHKTGGHDYAANLPANTVVSTNNMNVFGNMTATNALCVNGTCTNEAEFQRYKKSLPGTSVCVNNTCTSEDELKRYKSSLPGTSVCVNNICTNEAEFDRYKKALPGDAVCVKSTCLDENEMNKMKLLASKPINEICINETCINEENLKQIKLATSPLTSSSLLSQKVLGETTTRI
jgi:hypothetical protein